MENLSIDESGNFDFHYLLQKKTLKSAVSDIVDFGRNNSDEDFNLEFLQLLVHLLNRNYDVELSELENIPELVFRIFESKMHEGNLVLTETAKEFLCEFITSASGAAVINSTMINGWIIFLKAIVDNDRIPLTNVFKAETIHLLALFLDPLAALLSSIDPDDSMDGNSQKVLIDSINDIVQAVTEGFKYEKLSLIVAAEFVKALEQHHVLVSDSLNCLKFYMKLLLQENKILHLMALKNLTKLCYIQSIREKLIEFLFDKAGDESFMNVFVELISRSNLKLEAMMLLKAMTTLRDAKDFINNQMLNDIFRKIFTANKKIVAGAFTLVQTLERDFWIEVIKQINFTADIEWDRFFNTVSSIDGLPCNAETFIKLILDNVSAPATSKHSAVILLEYLKYKPEESRSALKELDTILLALLPYEGTFVTTTRIISTIDSNRCVEFYSGENHKLLSLIDCLAQAFDNFESPISLHFVLESLVYLTKLSPQYITNKVRIICLKYYDELLALYNGTEELSDLYTTLLTKLSKILEGKSWNIIPMSSVGIIFKVIDKLRESDHPDLFPLVVSFHTNVLRQVWVRLVLQRPTGLNDKALEKNIRRLFASIATHLEDVKMNVVQASHILRSFMEIALMFQPSMEEKHRHAAFTTIKFDLEKKDIGLIAGFVEEHVFGNEDGDTFHYRELILNAWIEFCRDYVNIPSATASEKIVRHYRCTSPFKAKIEILLNDILDRESAPFAFEKIVAFAILNLSNTEDLAGFRSFYQAIDEFLTRKLQDETKKLTFISSIFSRVLSKLKEHVMNADRDKNRLIVLEFVEVVIKNMEPAFKQHIVTYIPADLEDIGLRDTEKETLETFKQKLAN